MPRVASRQALRAQLASGNIVVAPGVFDGMSAQLAKRAGHSAAYLTGAGVAASGFGLPDIGLVTATETVERTGTYGREQPRHRPPSHQFS